MLNKELLYKCAPFDSAQENDCQIEINKLVK